MLMRLNKFLCVLLFCLLSVLKLLAQDPLPACPVKGKLMQSVKPMKEMKLLYDTIQVRVDLPATFKEVGYNEIIDSLGILSPVLEHLRLVKGGILEDTVRILHIGDSHIRGISILRLPDKDWPKHSARYLIQIWESMERLVLLLLILTVLPLLPL